MFHRLLIFSALGCLFAPAIASAQLPFSQQGQYLYREQMRRNDYSSPAPVYVEPAPAVDTSRSFYPAAQDRVRLDVIVPANAKIRVEGANTMQTGSHRLFESPALAAGNYRYDVQASWMENGKEITQRRSFAVRPGDSVRLNITSDGITVNDAR